MKVGGAGGTLGVLRVVPREGFYPRLYVREVHGEMRAFVPMCSQAANDARYS